PWKRRIADARTLGLWQMPFSKGLGELSAREEGSNSCVQDAPWCARRVKRFFRNQKWPRPGKIQQVRGDAHLLKYRQIPARRGPRGW
ncbi:MAG: hypothetical protein ABSG16_04425, partial [Candidatus Acidiferrum sp.]